MLLGFPPMSGETAESDRDDVAAIGAILRTPFVLLFRPIEKFCRVLRSTPAQKPKN